MLTTFAKAQHDPWTIGAEVGLQVARLSVVSNTAASHLSSLHTSPPFGIYFRSPESKSYLLSLGVGFNVMGANKEVYYERVPHEWVRIKDRYATVQLSPMYYRHIFKKEKIWLGIGARGQYVVRSYLKHYNPLPSGSAGLIFTPDVKKALVSIKGEIMFVFAQADISIEAAYALTPLIDDCRIQAFPMTVSLMVKRMLYAPKRAPF